MKYDTRHLKNFFPYAPMLFVAMCSVLVSQDAYSASVTNRSTSNNEETFEFENKTSMFDSAIGASSTSSSGTTSDDELAAMIRQQRNALNAVDAAAASQKAARVSVSTGQNACDIGLRQCMQSKCGKDFTNCSGDTDTAWGDKMDLCRLKLKCTGHEYQLFTAQIKADRDANAKLSNYNKIIDCGNRYNNCIINECGNKFSKCLGKSAGDLAISKCKKIQTECIQMDNGLASRTMNVFATLRQDAEKQIQRDEQRLYDMRDEMEITCRRLGAMFDQRSLDCVYTINFFADNKSTPYASKKAYAGGVFDCDPGWFGIDITTFKENAYRETIAQKSASAAMLGSGAGVAAGAITSGAIDRALDTQKAKKAIKDVEKADEKADKEAKKQEKDALKAQKKADKEAEKKAEKKKNDAAKAQKKVALDTNLEKETLCRAIGGEWLAARKLCRCTNISGELIRTANIDGCIVDTEESEHAKCKDNINRKYLFSYKDEPRYQEILTTLDSTEEEKLNAYLDTPVDTADNGAYNGVRFSYTAGQTPREYLPQPCWTLYRRANLMLANDAQKQFLNEKINEECNNG